MFIEIDRSKEPHERTKVRCLHWRSLQAINPTANLENVDISREIMLSGDHSLGFGDQRRSLTVPNLVIMEYLVIVHSIRVSA